LTSREFYSFSSLRSIAVYVTGFAGTLSIYFHAIQKENHEGVVFAIYFGLALVFVNLVPVLVSWLRKRFEVEEPEFVAYIPLIQSSLITLVAVPSFVSLKNDLYLLFVAAGFLVLTLVGRLKLKSAKLLEAVGNQSFVAIGISILLTALGANIESLKVDSAFILFEGLAIFGYALLAKNIRWANIGFAVTSLSILLAYSAWGTSKDNVVYFAVGAMLIGGVVNLGLIWATKKFSKESTITKLVTRITTGLSLLFIVVAAHRFIPLDEQSIWLLAAAPLVLALGIEIRKSNNFVFIYLGAALVASIPTGTDETYVSYFARVTVIALALAFAFIRRARSSGRIAWAAAAQLAAAFVAGFAAHTVDLQYKLNWRGPELYSVSIAILLGIAAWLTKKANSKAHQYLQLDVPVLVAAVPSLFFALIDFAGSTVESANRFVLAAGVIWGHNIWRGFERRKFGWLVAQSITGVIFGVAVARAVYENFQIVWSGPEIYSLAIFGTALVAIRLAGQMDLLKGSLVRFGLPVAILLTPSAIYSWSSVTRQFSELNATEITRTLLVLVLAIAVMVFGILRGNRGLNIVGTVELWLIAIPGLWFKTSAVDNGSADLELRGLLIAALAYWVISLVRQFTDAKLKSVIWIGIPVSIALAPAIFHTLSSLGSSELRTVDWWRFSIVLSASLVLLMVGALREIGGTFFPGLIGVLVTVLPYGFTPVTNKEWYLWAILLGVAGLLVWLAVRLENMRKAGREPSAWLRELK
jgi:hypothetical protein